MKKSERGKWPGEDFSEQDIRIPDFISENNRQPHYRQDQEPFYGQEGFEEPYQEPQPPKAPPVSKKQRNRTYGRVAYMFAAMFLALAGYMIYFNTMKIEGIRSNPNNAKMEEQKQYVVRGTIYSADGEILAGTNVNDDGSETRVYPYGSIFAHAVGYTTNGKSGLEAIYNNDLLSSNTSIIDQVGKEKNNEKLRGDSLILTLDTTLQRAAYDALGAYRGAVVVMEPDTGRVLAMVSKPDFDPNLMAERWEYLIAEDSGSPLLNRATQGLYPPGSTFKILTTLEYMREHPSDYDSYSYNCEGAITNNDVRIPCFDGTVHGYETLQTSFQNSCNTSFANIGLGLDNDKFKELCESFLFNGKLPTVLPYSSSQFVLNSKSSYGEMMQTAIGQGNTLVSPFHMALITCAVANGGELMYPYIVEKVENAQGVEVNETKPIRFERLMTQQEANVLGSYMQSVVEGGTASSLWGLGYTVAAKTGSAEYEVDGNTGEEENFSTHSWFVGYSNVEDPDIVVSIIAEDGGTGSSAAVPIARAIFDAYYYNY